MKKRLHIQLSILAFLFLIGINPSYAQCTFTGLTLNNCTNSPTVNLVPSNSGGAFSGPGVIGSVFSPSIAGPGTHTINYGFCASTYSVSAGIFAPTSTVGTGVSLGDDAVSTVFPIGFSFQFFCNTYTNFYISSNGFLTFNNNGVNACCQGLSMPTGTTPDNMIAYCWTDLNQPLGGGQITYTTVGTAPSRKLVVSLVGIGHHNSGLFGFPVTVQTILYESTNIIEIHSTSVPTITNNPNVTYSTTQGIQNNLGTVAYTIPGRNGTANWAATNDMYRFTPGTTCITSQTTVVSPSTISVVGNNSICVGSTASLTATGNTTYTWSTSSNSNSVAVSPPSNQTYSVSGTNSLGCIANGVITVTVDNTPTVSVQSSNGTSGVCPGKTLTLTGAGASGYSYAGGVTTVTNGVAFSIPATTSYTLTGTNACGSNTAAITVSIHPLPTIIPAASSPTLCSGVSLTLSATGTSTSYVWSGHTSSITGGVGFSPTVTATYSVIGTSALSCTNLATLPVTVVTTPTIFPTATPILICIGGSSTLNAQGASTYTWASASQTVLSPSFVVTPLTTGVSTYTITKSNANCVDTKMISVTTNSLPTIFAISTPTLVCALSPATLAVGGGQSYTWTAPGTPNNITFNGPSPIVYPSVSTTYTVAASDGTCISTTTVFLAADPVPTIQATTASSLICSGQSVILNASGGINYTWTATSGGTFYTSSISQTPAITTSYDLFGDNSFGCTSMVSQVVVVNPNPTITITSNKSLVCSGGPSTLTANGAANYTWTSNNALTNTTVVNPVNTLSGPVIYTVLGSYTTGCQGTKTVGVNVFVPVLTVSGNTNTCPGGLITLSAGGGNAGSYSWNTGTGVSNFQTLTTTLSAAAVFTISASTTSITVVCPSSKTVAVGIYANPVITAAAQRTTICQRESVDLYGQGGVSYVWNTSATTATITVAPTQQTNYTVTGTDANGCVSTGTIQVKVSNCVGINELSGNANGLLIYPNPNNGEFNIQTNSDIKLSLVNELGQAIRTFNLSGTNNHKVSVTDLAKGIYFITGQKDNVQIYEKIIVTK